MDTAAQTDLIAAVALPLPITVISELLGVPADHRAEFHDWSTTVVAGSLAESDAYRYATTSMVRYRRELLQIKRAAPADDLLSA
ncbi:MAG: hypothetical protein ACRDRI_09265 [Pseudonocardiaceae bacterium]